MALKENSETIRNHEPYSNKGWIELLSNRQDGMVREWLEVRLLDDCHSYAYFIQKNKPVNNYTHSGMMILDLKDVYEIKQLNVCVCWSSTNNTIGRADARP